MNDHRQRAQREKEWHEIRFKENELAASTGRFYLALDRWFKDYNNLSTRDNAQKVLEVGAGIESIALTETYPFMLLSIDISETAVDTLRRMNTISQAEFQIGDVHSLSYDDQSFDRVIGRGILHHLDLNKSIPELNRVLKKNGSVVFGEPLAGNPLINAYRFFTPSLRTPDERPLSRADISAVLDAFPGSKVTYYGFITLLPALFGWRHCPELLSRVDHFILNRLRLGRFLAWACIIHSGSRESVGRSSNH